MIDDDISRERSDRTERGLADGAEEDDKDGPLQKEHTIMIM